MKIFYGKSAGQTDIPASSPIDATLDVVLEIFRNLDPKKGFIGIVLDNKFTLQLMPSSRGPVRVELLDTSIPAWDACDADSQFAESLIRAAEERLDVFQIARQSVYKWERWDLAKRQVYPLPQA